ncbi:MAG: hypothetical protein ACOCYG_00315 [Spirochaetota bacterium]
MDNEREVGKGRSRRRSEQDPQALVERSKMLFLQEILREAGEEARQYSAHEEFAKTKRNRSLLVPGIILLLVALFGVGMFFTTRRIESSTQDVQVTIEDVEDVDLMEVLDTAQRLEDQIAAVQDRINDLEEGRDSSIAEVENGLQRDIRLIQEQTDLSEGERNARISGARDEADAEIDEIRAEYDGQIAEAEEELADLQQRLDQYDARRLEQAREQQEVMDNQKRLHELEMEELREDYEGRIANIRSNYDERIQELEDFQEEFEARMRERHQRELEELTLRYNPDLSDSEVGSLLAATVAPSLLDAEGISDFDQRLAREDVSDTQEYQDLGEQVAAFGSIVDRLQDIPYENSIPDALNQLEARNRRIIQEYERMWMELADTVDERDEVIASRDRAIRNLESTIGDLESRINQFIYALRGLTTENRENGYILDPRRSDRILVYLDRIRDVETGTTGLVFRQDDEFIGRIRFEAVPDGTTTASLVELADGKELRPFDKVLIVVQ